MRTSRKRFSWPLTLFLLVALTGCVQEESTQSTADVEAIPATDTADVVLSGEALYAEHCAYCHGPEGEGDGDIADALKNDPTDLTRMAAQHGGTFPEEYAREIIDGRTMIPSHGTREMPIWGNIWTRSDGVPSQEEVTRARIDTLIQYLRSIQETG